MLHLQEAPGVADACQSLEEKKIFAGGMGMTEILIILFIVFIIFGAGKLPQLGEDLGKGIRGFKKAIK